MFTQTCIFMSRHQNKANFVNTETPNKYFEILQVLLFENFGKQHMAISFAKMIRTD